MIEMLYNNKCYEVESSGEYWKYNLRESYCLMNLDGKISALIKQQDLRETDKIIKEVCLSI